MESQPLTLAPANVCVYSPLSMIFCPYQSKDSQAVAVVSPAVGVFTVTETFLVSVAVQLLMVAMAVTMYSPPCSDVILLMVILCCSEVKSLGPVQLKETVPLWTPLNVALRVTFSPSQTVLS